MILEGSVLCLPGQLHYWVQYINPNIKPGVIPPDYILVDKENASAYTTEC